MADATRLEVKQPQEYETRDGEKKTRWVKLGVAWATPGKGISVVLEALPLPQIDSRTGKLETRFMLISARSWPTTR